VILTGKISTVNYHQHTTKRGRLSLLPPFLCFISLDRKSCRCTLPLYTIRRVERWGFWAVRSGHADHRLNSRAGVFALSLATWHGM